MDYLKKPIGQLPPSWQELKTAVGSDSMVKVATLMENSLTPLHFSQIPLKDSTGNIRRIVTGNGLARWARVDAQMLQRTSTAKRLFCFRGELLWEKL